MLLIHVNALAIEPKSSIFSSLFLSDAGLGARKPTIDEEFEQYFSILKL